MERLEIFNVFHDAKSDEERKRWMDNSAYRSTTEEVANIIFEGIPHSHPLRVMAFGTCSSSTHLHLMAVCDF